MGTFCPTFENIKPNNTKCICQAGKDVKLGPTYESNLKWKEPKIGPILPCNIPKC